MKFSCILGATTAYRIRSDFNVDGTGRSTILGTRCNDYRKAMYSSRKFIYKISITMLPW